MKSASISYLLFRFCPARKPEAATETTSRRPSEAGLSLRLEATPPCGYARSSETCGPSRRPLPCGSRSSVELGMNLLQNPAKCKMFRAIMQPQGAVTEFRLNFGELDIILAT